MGEQHRPAKVGREQAVTDTNRHRLTSERQNGSASAGDAASGALEELEKSAEDWLNQLPETLQDEP
ncbi:hypothetical protein JI721_16405 [Alicyclobacillus cycloheptanicus]|uniref:Uncharacterized protein n=1 Tax=Alicyclobacillus cycloheptanicus TaxID=1457 RepID=A0ABT9XE04_9BACL|nr:hypothetical protein [Alicyclobacillus cycloheptanicus]MDQ0188526.1 hypothetical protein [Alicyclobacillus cycloheptanicus]WDM01212.1 hypothetical protein JI721_16405 [Alicyclobacillus cycloheptanicus]